MCTLLEPIAMRSSDIHMGHKVVHASRAPVTAWCYTAVTTHIDFDILQSNGGGRGDVRSQRGSAAHKY